MKFKLFYTSLFLLIMLVSCRVVRKNRTYSQLTTNLMKVDTSSISGMSIEVRNGDSSYTIEESFLIGGFVLDEDETTIVVDSIETQSGKVVVAITPTANGKKIVSYKATTPARTIKPKFEQTKITYAKKQTGNTTQVASKAIVDKATTKRSNLNGWVLAALFVSVLAYIIFLILKYLKK